MGDVVAVGLMGGSGCSEAGRQVEDGGRLGSVGDAQVGHLAVEGCESIGVGGESHFDVVGMETGACSCLRFVAVVGELLEVDACIVPGLVDLGAHAPALARFRHEVARFDEVIESVALLCVSERATASAKCFAGLLDLLNDGFERSAFSEASVRGVRVGEKFKHGASAVQDDVLAHAAPIDFVPAVEEHLAESCLDETHELERLLSDTVLADSFGDHG